VYPDRFVDADLPFGATAVVKRGMSRNWIIDRVDAATPVAPAPVT
jgi:hypothetical protein